MTDSFFFEQWGHLFSLLNRQTKEQTPKEIPIAEEEVQFKGLALSPIKINEDYRVKWNVHYDDFVCLTLDGELVRPTLYRVGGLNYPKPGKDRYFKLLKHVEAFYPKHIAKTNKGDAKHLESRWCILDKDGNEKFECNDFHSPYLIKDSPVFSVDGSYYNIETNELYCKPSSTMESTEFLFLENRFDKDKSKRGVMRIRKSDGTFEMFQ